MDQKITKLVASILIAIYCAYYFHTLGEWHFIDNVNLIIHEAGHFVFMFFGEFVRIAGGSLLQILMPILFGISFKRSGQLYSSSVMYYWLAINFFSVGYYASDALTMNLPLLGGDNVMHDWNYLLSTTGLLGQTPHIANTFYFLGFLAILFGLLLSFKSSLNSTPYPFSNSRE
jgi:hypothetical protein